MSKSAEKMPQDFLSEHPNYILLKFNSTQRLTSQVEFKSNDEQELGRTNNPVLNLNAKLMISELLSPNTTTNPESHRQR